MPKVHQHFDRVAFDLNTSATCIEYPSLVESPVAGVRASQSVASVRNVKEGPKAGFLTVEPKADWGLCGVDVVVLLMTKMLISKPRARARSWRMNVVMMACPCAETALSRGPNKGVIQSITTHRIFAREGVPDVFPDP